MKLLLGSTEVGSDGKEIEFTGVAFLPWGVGKEVVELWLITILVGQHEAATSE